MEDSLKAREISTSTPVPIVHIQVMKIKNEEEYVGNNVAEGKLSPKACEPKLHMAPHMKDVYMADHAHNREAHSLVDYV